MIELILSFTASIAIGYLLSRMSAFPVLRRLTDISTTIVIYLLISVGLGIGLKPGLGGNGIALQYLQGTYCFDIHSIFSEEAGSVCSCCGSRCHFYGRLPARNHKELRA